MERLILATLLLQSMTACKTIDNSGEIKGNLNASALADRSVALYGIDGSGNACIQSPKLSKNAKKLAPDDLTVICQIMDQYAESRRAPLEEFYWEGVKDFKLASDWKDIFEKATKRICDDYRSHKFEQTVIIGYSRGAILAAGVAWELNQKCRRDGQSEDYRVIVADLDLIDAVETSIWHAMKQHRDGLSLGKILSHLRDKNEEYPRSIPDGVSVLHVHKLPRDWSASNLSGKVKNKSNDNVDKNSNCLFSTTEFFPYTPNYFTDFEAKYLPRDNQVQKMTSLKVITLTKITHGNIGRGIEGDDPANIAFGARKKWFDESVVYSHIKKSLSQFGINLPYRVSPLDPLRKSMQPA